MRRAPALKHVVYTAKWKASVDDFRHMVFAAQNKNAENSITGFIVLNPSTMELVQHIEGPPHAIDNLWMTIINDRRADNYKKLCIFEKESPERQYRSWMWYDAKHEEEEATERAQRGDIWAMERFPRVTFEERMKTFEEVRGLGLDRASTMRFCIARGFRLRETRKMIRDTVTWRNSICYDILGVEECGALLNSRYLTVSRGRDRDGQMIALFDIAHFCPGEWDVAEYTKFIALFMKTFEAVVAESPTEQKIVAVADLSQFSMWSHFNTKFGTALVHTLCDNFPERLQKFVVWNAPVVFRSFWSVIVHLLDGDTRERFLWTSDLEELKKVAAVEHISTTLGGREEYISAVQFISENAHESTKKD